MSTEAGHVVTAGCAPPAVDSSPSSTLSSDGNAAGKSQESPFPLNSRRLTVPYLKAVAKAVGLPVTGSADETRVMIDGKLEEMGRDSRNVQVIVTRDQHGHETLSLRDVNGEFVDVGMVEDLEGAVTVGEGGVDTEESGSTTSERSPHSADELEDLKEWNATLSAHNAELVAQVSSLKEEVSEVRDKLTKETERVGEMWKMNCAQVTGFDETFTAKDSEIARLKARISELERARPTSPVLVPTPTPVSRIEPTVLTRSSHTFAAARRGKAPPVSEFSGDDPKSPLEDWLPSLEQLVCGMRGQKRRR